MSMDDYELNPPGQSLRGGGRVAPALSNSPQVAVGLGALISNFGLSTAIRSVRKTVEEKTALVSAERLLGQELVELEKQKEKWANISTIVEGVKTDTQAALVSSQAHMNKAKVELVQSKIELKLVEKRLADLELLEETEAAAREAQRYEMKARAAEAKARFEKSETPPKKADGSENIAELKKEYDDVMAMKKADVEKYGSDEKMPEFLRAAYERAEDKLGFR